MKLHDDNFRDATNRITEILQGDLPQQFLWHRDCRAKYMNKREIERKFKTELKRDTKQSSSAARQNVSKIAPIEWKQCIFCQQDQKEKVYLIQEMKVSNRILQAAKYDSFLRVRLVCVNDLIAAEGRYHLTCKNRFERRAKHMESLPSRDMQLEWICQELEQSAKQADILDLVHVWDRYSTLANEAQLNIPSRFLS